MVFLIIAFIAPVVVGAVTFAFSIYTEASDSLTRYKVNKWVASDCSYELNI